MEHDLSAFTQNFEKIGSVFRMMLTKPLGLLAMFCTVTLPALTTTEKTLILLTGLFIADFITGVIASWVEFRASLLVLPGSGKRYVFSSAKMKMSGVKFITYGLGLLTAYSLEIIFIIHEFEPKSIVTQKLTLTTVVSLFFCFIEFYSIFFENIKRMGFDILQTVKKIAKEGWGLYKEVKDEPKNNT